MSAPTELREELRALTPARLLKRCANLRPGGSLEQRGTLLALRLLARRIQLLTAEVRALKREITALVERLAPELLAQAGVGPISAAQVIVAWSHPGRLRYEPASPASAAPHRSPPAPARPSATASTAVATANSTEPCTRSLSTAARDHATAAYIDRRVREGKTFREAVRCLNASSHANSSDYSRRRHRHLTLIEHPQHVAPPDRRNVRRAQRFLHRPPGGSPGGRGTIPCDGQESTRRRGPRALSASACRRRPAHRIPPTGSPTSSGGRSRRALWPSCRRARLTHRARDRKDQVRALVFPPGTGGASAPRSTGGHDLAASRLPRQPRHRKNHDRPAARGDVPRDGAAAPWPPRRDRSGGARGPVVGITAIRPTG